MIVTPTPKVSRINGCDVEERRRASIPVFDLKVDFINIRLLMAPLATRSTIERLRDKVALTNLVAVLREAKDPALLVTS